MLDVFDVLDFVVPGHRTINYRRYHLSGWFIGQGLYEERLLKCSSPRLRSQALSEQRTPGEERTPRT
jgi:hypothetical protein